MIFAAPLGYMAPRRGMSSSRDVLRLQYALRNLSAFTADPALQIVPDGRIGPRTRAAVNRALMLYAENASPALRSGMLSIGQILRNSDAIASSLEEMAPL